MSLFFSQCLLLLRIYYVTLNSLILLMFSFSFSRMAPPFSVFFFPVPTLEVCQLFPSICCSYFRYSSRPLNTCRIIQQNAIFKLYICYYFLCHAVYTTTASENEAPFLFSNVNTVLLAMDHVNVPDQVLFETLLQTVW